MHWISKIVSWLSSFQSYLVFILLFLVWRRYFFKGHKVSIYWIYRQSLTCSCAWILDCLSIFHSYREDIRRLIPQEPDSYYVYNPTLKRFFLFHFQFPFLLCGFRILHLFYLHFLSCLLYTSPSPRD